MKITRDVILDLWSIYEAGDASEDTRNLVDSFLSGDREFAELLRNRTVEAALTTSIDSIPLDNEAMAFEKARRGLFRFGWLYAFAVLFTGLAVARLIQDVSFDVSPFHFTFLAALAVVCWGSYLAQIMLARRRILRPYQERTLNTRT